MPETDNCNNARATPGSFRCNSRNCTTCAYIEHARGRDNYTFYSTGETYKIKSHIICNTFNVIYMIQCHLCIKFALSWGNQTPPQGPFLDIDALYFTPPVVTSKPQFQNTFSAIATPFPICYLSLVLKHLDMNAIVLGKQVRRTSLIKPKPLSLWE